MFCIHINKYVYFKFNFFFFFVVFRYKLSIILYSIKWKSKSGFLFGYIWFCRAMFFSFSLSSSLESCFVYLFIFLLKCSTEIESFSCEQYWNLNISFRIKSLYVRICAMSKWNCIKAKLNEFIGYFNIFFFRVSTVYCVGRLRFRFFLFTFVLPWNSHKNPKRMNSLALLWGFQWIFRLGVALCVCVHDEAQRGTNNPSERKPFFFCGRDLLIDPWLHNALKAF